MINMNYLLSDAANHKPRVHQLDSVGEFIQANVNHRILLKLDSRYGKYLPGYSKYFGIPLSLKKSIYGMSNYVK